MTLFNPHIKINSWRKKHIKFCNFSTTIVNQDTEINIYVDDSGSMPETRDDLIEMRDNNLKETLLPFYNDDETLYNQKVSVILTGVDDGERCFARLNEFSGDINNHSVINMMFINEAHPDYHGNTLPFDTTNRTGQYSSDITDLRDNILNNWSPNSYQGIVFEVRTGGTTNSIFIELMKAVRDGIDSYAPPWGVSDIPEVEIDLDIAENQGGQFYADLIESKIL